MKKLDLTLGNMENSRFNYIYGSLVSAMESSTFTHTELLCLSMVYNKFVLQNGPKSRFMTAVQLSGLLKNMFKISNKRINDLIVRTVCYNTDCKELDFSPAQHCTLESFIKMFTIYFSDDLEERMNFVFKVYDEDGVGYLSRPQVAYFVDCFFEGDDEDEAFECRTDMRELIFQKFDADKDTFISFDEYRNIVRETPALLEFLGIIFPSPVQMGVIMHCINLYMV